MIGFICDLIEGAIEAAPVIVEATIEAAPVIVEGAIEIGLDLLE